MTERTNIVELFKFASSLFFTTIIEDVADDDGLGDLEIVQYCCSIRYLETHITSGIRGRYHKHRLLWDDIGKPLL